MCVQLLITMCVILIFDNPVIARRYITIRALIRAIWSEHSLTELTTLPSLNWQIKIGQWLWHTVHTFSNFGPISKISCLKVLRFQLKWQSTCGMSSVLPRPETNFSVQSSTVNFRVKLVTKLISMSCSELQENYWNKKRGTERIKICIFLEISGCFSCFRGYLDIGIYGYPDIRCPAPYSWVF